MKYGKDARYYLQNAQKEEKDQIGESYSVNLLVDGIPKRDFIDISALDFETLKIDGEKKSELLKPYNQKIDLTDNYFVGIYPFKTDQVDIHPAIFDSNNQKAQYYLNRLRYFAEQRKRKCEKSDSVKLEKSKILEDYIYRLLTEIMKTCSVRLSSYNSVVPFKIKKYLKEKMNDYPSVTPENYINGRINVITNIFSSYPELRKVTYEYLKYLEKDNTQTRLQLQGYAQMHHNNLSPLPIYGTEDEIVEQLSFFDNGKTKGLRR